MAASGERAARSFEVSRRQRLHDGFFKLDRLLLRHTTVTGDMSPLLHRELIVQRPAVAVLLYDPRADTIVLVEQFRAGIIDRTDHPWLLETAAGLAEPGEAAGDVARREVLEECGLVLGRLEPVCRYFPSPGGFGEEVAVFLGEVDSGSVVASGGLASEGEDIRVHVLAAEAAFSLLNGPQPLAANLLIPLLYFREQHAMVRRRWLEPR